MKAFRFSYYFSYSYVSCTYIRFEAPSLRGGFVRYQRTSTSTAIPIIPSFSRILFFTSSTLLHPLYCNVCPANGQNMAISSSDSSSGHDSLVSLPSDSYSSMSQGQLEQPY